MSSVPRLSSTSYIVLGLLCVRSWSAYELAQQVQRGWQDVWPRAARGIYNEPKKLATHGLVSQWTEQTGQRTRAIYEANDQGREAFREWLNQPPQTPAFESEALVRVVFADHGSLVQLRRAISEIREHAHARSEALLAQGSAYLTTGGPFPERIHLLHLVGGFLAEQHAAMLRWADWAETEIARWNDTTPASNVPNLRELGEHVSRLLADNLQTIDRSRPGH